MEIQEKMLLRKKDVIFRVLQLKDCEALLIDCLKRTMPCWHRLDDLADAEMITEEELLAGNELFADALSSFDTALAHKRYTIIAGIIHVIGDKLERSRRIRETSAFNHVSAQTVRHYLCEYLVFQDVRCLALVKPVQERELTVDEKNMRWALNKFYYTSQKLPLTAVFIKMLSEKYVGEDGSILEDHPSIYQFRRFQKKHEKIETTLISRQGLKDYQRNCRPLLGDGVQAFAPAVGCGMLDATICDIYLVNDAGELVGRPELVAGVDAYSGLCIGYLLAWEGGVHSLRGLTLSILEDKVELCRRHGILIEEKDWPCKDVLPGTLVTDMGSEYTSGTFEQISELGVTVVNLDAYRPELKGPIEKFFDCVQSYFKPELKGRGVIEPDWQERGTHDYRKDACLTLREFETILLRCILYYNAQRVVEDFPYTEEMLGRKIRPYASAIYAYGKDLPGTNLIPVERARLMLTLLPRTEGRFTREGLKANGLRYRRPKEDHSFNEMFLRGGTASVAYNPDNVNQIWLIREGEYIPFDLIESRFHDRSSEKVLSMKERQRELVRQEQERNLQAKVDLAGHIEVIASRANKHYAGETKIKNVRETRRRERNKTHRDYTHVEGGAV